jgi:hypothetical protein
MPTQLCQKTNPGEGSFCTERCDSICEPRIEDWKMLAAVQRMDVSRVVDMPLTIPLVSSSVKGANLS